MPKLNVTGIIATLWLALAGAAPALAQSAPPPEEAADPVVVELFTSQGCSSCPPADRLLAELAKRPDVIALALHVDYWDYIGWKDAFAKPAFTARQKAYARAAGRRSVYTPQMIIDGVRHVMGSHPVDVSAIIRARRDAPSPVTLTVEAPEDGSGRAVTIRATAARELGPLDVQIVRYTPEAEVEITRGENAGRMLRYANIVEDWRVIANWTGAAPLELSREIEGDLPAVVVIQEAGHGAILAAARLR